MKKYKYLIFDLDDTVLDFKDTERQSLKSIFEKYQIPYDEEHINKYREINKRLWNELEKELTTKEKVLNGRFEEFLGLHGHEIDGSIVEDEYRQNLNKGHKTMPKAIETLKALREKGYKIYAGTNGLGETQRQRLTDSAMMELFDDIFISEEIGVEKPNVKFFDAIFTKYDFLNKEETLMIGDSLTSDIQGAINYGIDSVWCNIDSIEIDDKVFTYEIREIEKILEILN